MIRVAMMRVALASVVCAFTFGCHSEPVPEVTSAESTTASQSGQHSEGPPTIKHAVGAVFRDEKPQLTVKVLVKNDRSRTVRFSEVRTTCSCSGGELDKMELTPGEQTTLHLTANLLGRFGPQRFVCYLLEETGAAWPVEVSATVYVMFRTAEPSVVFGLLDLDESATRSVSAVFYAKDEAGLPPDIHLRGQPKRLRVEIDRPKTEKDENGVWCRTWPISLTLPGQNESGPGEERVTLTVPALMTIEPLYVLAQWSIRSLYRISPARIFFPARSSTGAREKAVTIRRRDGGPVSVKELTVEGGAGIKLEQIATDTASVLELRVNVNDRIIDAPATRQIRVLLNDEYQSVVRIPVAIAAARP